MTASHLCVIYISEALNPHIIQNLASLAVMEGKVSLAHSFRDLAYNRTSFYLLSKGPEFIEPALRLCNYALDSLDFSQHKGTHPALGVVDHVCISPLGGASLSSAVDAAQEFASRLHATRSLPFFTYGHASPQQARLQNIRRFLGYFDQAKLLNDPSFSFGHFTADRMQKQAILPDFGTVDQVTPQAGICCLGVGPFVRNLNIRFREYDPKTQIAQITAQVRCPEVEALTLKHEEGSFEIACNLLQPKIMTPETILAQVEKLSPQFNVQVVHSYTTGPSEEELLAMLP